MHNPSAKGLLMLKNWVVIAGTAGWPSPEYALRKRALVEYVNDELKNIAQIEHSRLRSFANFITNALCAISAYCFFPKKPSISLEFVSDNQLTLF